MKRIKWLIAIASSVALFTAPIQAHAQDYCTDAGGYCYEEARRAPCIAPAIALGTIALIAIIAIAVQKSSGHGHSHCL